MAETGVSMRGWHYIEADLEETEDGLAWQEQLWDWQTLEHWFAIWS